MIDIGAFGFAAALMFFSFFNMCMLCVFTFAETQQPGFDDIGGDAYGEIGGSGGDKESGSGISYNTADGPLPASSHDL